MGGYKHMHLLIYVVTLGIGRSNHNHNMVSEKWRRNNKNSQKGKLCLACTPEFQHIESDQGLGFVTITCKQCKG